jgi:hypothetical protein
MLRMVLVALISSVLSISIWAQTCTDIRSFDFKNATIHVAEADRNESPTPFDSSRGLARTFHLRNGIALSYEDAAPNLGTPDWQTKLVFDRAVHPEPSIWIRVIGLEDDHMSGTGAWHYVLAFSCDKGHLARRFQFTSEGLKLSHLDDHTLQLDQAIWLSDDSHAEPSGHRELTYTWDARVHQYRLTNK